MSSSSLSSLISLIKAIEGKQTELADMKQKIDASLSVFKTDACNVCRSDTFIGSAIALSSLLVPVLFKDSSGNAWGKKSSKGRQDSRNDGGDSYSKLKSTSADLIGLAATMLAKQVISSMVVSKKSDSHELQEDKLKA